MNEEPYTVLKPKWLEENGYTDGDVMVDEDGGEYVLSDEDEYGEREKIYIAEQI